MADDFPIHSKQSEEIDRLIREAIAQKRLIRFRYSDRERIAEPHDYGTIAAIPRLLCYQTAGKSNSPLPNWRLMNVVQINGLELLDQTFPGSRGGAHKKHMEWDEIFARVSD